MIASVRINANPASEIEIVKISNQAKAAKLTNPATIDATIGALYDDDGAFFTSSALQHAISDLTADEQFPYTSTLGPISFQKPLEKWLFGKAYDVISPMNPLTIANVGASSALSNLFFSYLSPGEAIILPDSYWNVYQKMLTMVDATYIEYEMFKDGHFNFAAFKALADDQIKKKGRLVTLLNTPNHNPTGYSLSDQEFQEFIAYCNSLAPHQVVLILDVAYLDFEDYDKGRSIFKYLPALQAHVLTSIVYSCSKTFSAYGLRLGSTTFLSHDSATLKNVKTTQTQLIRSRYGSPNHQAISAFIKIMNTPTLLAELNDQLQAMRDLLAKRFALLSLKLKEGGIQYWPYQGGFFVFLPHPNSIMVYEKLKEHDIFVIPFNKGLRIALCSMKSSDVERFYSVLKSII